MAGSVGGSPDYIDRFEKEIESSKHPHDLVNNRVSACAFIALDKRGSPFAKTHPELKNRALLILNKQVSLKVGEIDFRELVKQGDLILLFQHANLIQQLSEPQKIELLKLAGKQRKDICKIICLQIVPDTLNMIEELIRKNDWTTVVELQEVISNLTAEDKASLLSMTVSDEKLYHIIVATVSESDLTNDSLLRMIRRYGGSHRLRSAAAKIDLPYHLEEYKFDRTVPEDKATLFRLRQQLAINGYELGRCIQYLDLDPQDPKERLQLIELAKECARNDPAKMSELVQNFGLNPLKDREALLEILEICAEKEPLQTIRNISNFGFDLDQEPALFDSLISNTILRWGAQALTLIEELKLSPDDPKGLEKILHIARQFIDLGKGHELLDHFQALKLKNYPKAILQIAHLAANSTSVTLPFFIAKLGIDFMTPEYEAERTALAKECAAHGQGVAAASGGFGFDPINNPKEVPLMIEMAFLSALFDVKRFYTACKIFAKKIPLGQQPLWLRAFVDLNDEALKTHYPNDTIITPLIDYVKTIDNPAIQNNLRQLIGYLIIKREEIPESERASINRLAPLFLEIFKLQEPSLREPLINLVLQKRPTALSIKEAAFETLMKSKNISPRKELKEKMSFKNRMWKDSSLENTYLTTVLEMIKTETLSAEQTVESLEKAFEDPKKTKDQLLLLQAILYIGDPTSLQKETPLSDSLMVAIRSKFPYLQLDSNDFERLQKTFLASRNPYAFFIYAANVTRLNKPSIETGIRTVFDSVLDGTFQSKKQQLEGNPHLQQLAKNHPKVLEAWNQTTEETASLSSSSSLAAEDPPFKVARRVIQAALQDRHLSPADYPLVYDYLSGKPLSEVKQSLIAASRNKDPNASLQLKIVSMFEENFEKNSPEQIKNLVSQIINLTPEKSEFQNDLKELQSLFLKQKEDARAAYLSNTDNPLEILLAGTDVAGSCQRVDGSPDLNQGLLGYLLNGQTRMLSLKLDSNEPETPITARAIVRILIDEKTKQPVLLMERIYPKTTSPQYRKVLIDFAKREAARLQIPIVSVEEGDRTSPYPGTLTNLGGRFPEYVDSADGIQTDEYQVYKTFYL